jgi:hypothetical protein
VAWFRVTRGRLEYNGRITRDPFTKWSATGKGAEAIARAARAIRFSLIGRNRSARRRTWRALEAATRTGPMAAAFGAEAARFMEVLADLSYAVALPRAHIALHRLVLVPRAMIAGRAQSGLVERLDRAAEFSHLDEDVRIFLLNQLAFEMDDALRRVAPSPRRPVQARDEWACVGISSGTVWTDPLWTGDTTGHVFMYEFPRAGLRRRERHALEAAIQELTAASSSMSRAERFALVRAASLQGRWA